ncbi:major capsid protein [Massilia sp. CCM 8734]|uniref:major capsid protein n=1 Tax=Massilia sp. CCM 8734 TaxID=2609283 RepID=UPI00142389ED|nr:major capsid protein [Massilia sp. CCM 8734]
MKFSSLTKKLVVVASVVLAAPMAMAVGTGPDLTPLTSAIDFSTVITAVLAIAGLLATVYLAIKGAKIVLSMLKST